MAAPTRVAAAALLLLAAAAVASAQTKGTFTEPPAAVDQSELPVARPPLWKFRTYSDSKISFKEYGSGAIEMRVEHKPLPGVDGKMMQWLFANLASGVATSPIDNGTYPMFLLYHPRDHAKHTCSEKPCKSGAYTTFVEFPLTECNGSSTDNGTSISPADGPMTCPSVADKNPGFMSTTPLLVWNSSIEITNGNPRVNSLSNSKVAFFTRRCSSVGCGNIIQTTHSWKFDKKTSALSVVSTLRVGLAGYAKSNTRIKDGWRGSLDIYTKFHRTALHFTEEIGGLLEWLPAAYAAANPQKIKGPKH